MQAMYCGSQVSIFQAASLLGLVQLRICWGFGNVNDAHARLHARAREARAAAVVSGRPYL